MTGRMGCYGGPRRGVVTALACLLFLGACGDETSQRGSPKAGTSGAGNGGNAGNGQGGSGGDGNASGGAGGISIGGGAGAAGAGGDCERDVNLTAVTLGKAEPFDLIIVADHSDSLSWSRDELASGLKDLLASVEGRTFRVFLLTPTQYGASSAAAQMPFSGTSIVSWQDPATGDAYEHAVTNYTQTCTNADLQPITCPSSTGMDPYKVSGTWEFVMPEPIAAITPELSAAEFAQQQQAVADAILAVAGSGSPTEQPLCTLARYITQDAAALPQNAVFLLISDEDDTSDPAECLASFQGELIVKTVQSGTLPCSEDCDAYRYNMLGDNAWKRLELVCAAFDDVGNQIPGTEKSLWVNTQVLPNCDGVVEGVCSSEEAELAARFCESGFQAVSCQRQCQTLQTSCNLDFPDTTLDLCTTSFEYLGETYDNLDDYCTTLRGGEWRDCTSSGIDWLMSDVREGRGSPNELVRGSLSDYFREQAQLRFGADGHLVEAIVFDPAFSCELNAGQSYATNLVALVGDRSKVFPLCEDYAPALAGISGFAETLIETEFTLTLEDDETVTQVFVIGQDGKERLLRTQDYAYDVATKLLSIQPSVLSAKDATLRVEITSDCIPVVE